MIPFLVGSVIFLLIISATFADFGLCFLAIIIATSYFSGNISNIIEYVNQKPLETVAMVIAYFLTGICWSFFKWARYVITDNRFITLLDNVKRRDASLTYNRIFKNIVSSKKDIDQFTLTTDFSHAEGYYNNSLSLTSNANRISSWIIAWPVSILIYLFSDLLVDLCAKIVLHFAKIYHKCAEIAFEYFLSNK
jgi:hypothetical protein